MRMVMRAGPEHIQRILGAIPHREPFRFIDGIERLTKEEVRGWYTFPENAQYYRGHFPNQPVTPGVLLTECMVQIGVLPLGLWLFGDQAAPSLPVLTQCEMEFLKVVLPDTKVWVMGHLEFFRRNTIRCRVEMANGEGETLSLGLISAMFIQYAET